MFSSKRLGPTFLLLAGLGFAPSGVAEAQPERPELRAHRFTEAPEIDGEVLSDPHWQVVEAATDFVQVRPFEGRAASERTEVRVAFDKNALYIAVVCFRK